ncbi:sulfatase-like hydrolase/transferase [Acuticoccus sp. MNP-M23]|uniref:sulfatase-like hydrolase/transferase n=1 Tax=Acuticoccus sp. MNP-M23 TaxID=3072793 RepID=UPI00281671CD|nr:sulfatase-like hydrolase/transferase [Acuticoccus sp. MNP-M23]WMS44010.1 sulfatase-like hydrolase/transferase [Acuticoccus sp. MNP-M23]
MTQKPNIILIIADDHRSQSLGVHGAAVDTPNLDALAARGLDFTNAHCQGGFNAAVCVPSRASLMTGRSVYDLTPEEDRTAPDYSAGQIIPPAFPILPERLREAGYRTHGIGKWHNDKAAFARGFSSAEAVFFGGMCDHDKMILQDHDPSGTYDESRARHVPGHSTDIFRDAALRFLAEPGDAPYFLYVAMTAPHDPRTPPADFAVDPATVELPAAYAPIHPFDNGATTIRDEELEAFPRSEDAIRQHIADYHGMITHLDDAVGQIVAAAGGADANTVVVYTADHGLALGNHGLMGKQNLYEHSIGIPLLMAGPEMAHDQRSNLVWHGDTHATVLGLAGLTPDAGCDDCIDLRKPGATRPLFGAVYRNTQRMIRDDRFKYIAYRRDLAEADPGSHTEQLFDLASDPHEQINLAFVPEHRATRDRLAAALRDWQRARGEYPADDDA